MMLPLEELLKEALHTSVFRSVKPAKAIAAEVGLDYSSLQKFASNGEPSHLPFRRLPMLVASVDNHALLDFLEAQAGRIAFAVPSTAGLCGKQTGMATREFGEFLSSVGDAQDDLTPDNAARIVREGEDVLRAVAAVMEHARRIASPAIRVVNER